MEDGNPRIFNSKRDANQRFGFGKNWQHFLQVLNPERIGQAESSLRQMLGSRNLEGKTFLDVGSGSGLFSLAARRLGARVHSFDFDPDSVACTLQLKGKFYVADQHWRVERGSALDKNYLFSLGIFDIVYSWGVLHHTGAMWEALGNMPSLVKPDGKLFIAIYNDQGVISDVWHRIKKTYNRTSATLRFVFVWPIGFFFLAGMTVKDFIHLRRPRIFAKSYNARGMSAWTDVLDWIGGYPFEVASRDQIVDFYSQRGFRLDGLVSCGRKSGCNQFLFTRLPEAHKGGVTGIE